MDNATATKTYKIEGNTYAVRDVLKDNGCKWDAVAKVWTASDISWMDRYTPTYCGPAKAKAIQALRIDEIA